LSPTAGRGRIVQGGTIYLLPPTSQSNARLSRCYQVAHDLNKQDQEQHHRTILAGVVWAGNAAHAVCQMGDGGNKELVRLRTH